MIKTAIVILNWNGSEMLRKYLPSVIAACPSDAQVVVADNGSTDDSCTIVADEFPSVRLIKLPKNYGFAEGYNQALAQVQAQYFVLLNSDVRVETDWLQPLTDFMDEHPEVAACQPKLLAERQPDHFEYAGACGGYIDRFGYPFCRGRIMTSVERDKGQYQTPAPIFWASGAALMIRKEDWENVGGLDGSFFAHMEEVDLCWRLRARGRLIYCVPESQVYHVGGGTLAQGNPRKTYLNFRNNLLLLYKNLPDNELRSALRVRKVLDYVAALKFLLSGSWGEAKAVYRARRDFYRIRDDYQEQRQTNLEATTTHPIPEMYPKSLLAAYYLKGRKTFDKLNFHPTP